MILHPNFLRAMAFACLMGLPAAAAPLWTPAPAEAQPQQQRITFHVLLNKPKCQMAIWLADDKGIFQDTIYVTRKTAVKGLGNRSGKLDAKIKGARLSVLPVWAHHRGIDYGGGNFYPPRNKSLPEAITSATPKAGSFSWSWHPGKSLMPGKYYYYIEVNKSFDDNEYHNYSWYRGQPSVVWKGSLIVGDKPWLSRGTIIGHGHPAGAKGGISTDLMSLTSALTLIGNISVTFEP